MRCQLRRCIQRSVALDAALRAARCRLERVAGGRCISPLNRGVFDTVEREIPTEGSPGIRPRRFPMADQSFGSTFFGGGYARRCHDPTSVGGAGRDCNFAGATTVLVQNSWTISLMSDTWRCPADRLSAIEQIGARRRTSVSNRCSGAIFNSSFSVVMDASRSPDARRAAAVVICTCASVPKCGPRVYGRVITYATAERPYCRSSGPALPGTARQS